MKKITDVTPPAWADQLLQWYCAPHLLEDLQGDLHERFNTRIQTKGVLRAKLWYVWDVFTFFRPYVLRRKNEDQRGYRYSLFFRHYVKIAFRNIKRDKQYLAINTIGLALGIGCALLLIAYIFTELSFDRHVQNSENVYRVSCSTLIDAKQTDFAPLPPAIGLAMKTTLPQIERVTRLIAWYNFGSSELAYQDYVSYQDGIFAADSTVFDVLDYHLIIGNKTALQNRDRIVLSNRLAVKLFGPDYALKADLLHTVIMLDDHELAIAGVIEDVPYTSHLRPEALVSWEGYGDDNIWNDSHAYTYLRLSAGTDPGQFQEQLNIFITENENIIRVAEEFGAKLSLYIQPLTAIHLDSNKMYELMPGGNRGYLYAFATMAAFFLLSSGINYTNLSIAASGHRYKEIGVRKVMGALRDQIQKQFVTESAFMIFFAGVGGLILFYLLIPRFNEIMDYQLNISLLWNPLFLVISVGTILLLTLLSGLYPAFYLSLLNPVVVFKNQVNTATGKARFRKVLLVAQFSISAMMIIAVLAVTMQMNFLSKKELGFNKENVMILSVPGPSMKQLPALKEEIMKISGVSGAAVCDYVPGISTMIDEHFVERANGEMKSSTVSRLRVDKDYLKVLGLSIVTGRNFDPAFPADYESSFIVNEAAVRAYGWDKSPQDALGRKVNGFNYGKEGTVIGVIKDVNLFSLKQSVEPLILNFSDYAYYLYVRIESADIPATVRGIEKVYHGLVDNPLEFQFLDERFERLYEADRKMNAALISGAQVLIFISCVGLFGLSAFLVMQRTKEIGVRKVMGASIREIMVLLSKDYLRLILIANAIAIPVVYLLIQKWLGSYAYRVDFPLWVLIIPLLSTLVLALLSISYQVIKASRINPVNVLKYE